MPGQTPCRVVIELEWGVTVYPARAVGDRWRAVWYENGQRRQCQAVSEDRLAARLDKVIERLATGALNLERPGTDLIAYYPVTGPVPGRQSVVPQARAYPAPAVRAFRRPGHRRGRLPRHHDRAHAADRQRPAHPGGRQACPGDDLSPGQRRD
jgi:hypothetical protein